MSKTSSMEVTLAGIKMKNPVMVASGTFGYGSEYADVVDLNQLGAMVVKGIRIEPWEGNSTPRMVEVQGGLVNAIGLQNPGAEAFISDDLPFLRQFDVPVIVNIWGKTLEEYEAVAARFEGVDGVHALEINISCPNIKEGGIAFGTQADMAGELVAVTRKATGLPLIPKLAPNVPDIGAIARAVRDAGADAISLINTIPAMVIDVESRRPVLANVVGGLSGPAVHPVAVKLVWEVAKAVDIPIIGMGGITQAREAIELMIAGASAVAVGTANFTDPTTAANVVQGIQAYLDRHEMDRVSDLVGSLDVS